MECDVAVLGGGPGGYTAAIRAAQLGAKTVCIEKEPELGGTCLRVGCIPTKAWVQTAFALKEAEETFAKLGVRVGEPQLDLGTANEWKAGVVKQMTSGVASLFKANGVELDKRKGIAADEHRRTTVPHIYAVGDCAGYWQLAHTAFREGEVAAENALGHDAVVDNRGVPRPIYTDPEIAAVGLTEAQAREQYGDDVLTGTFPFAAIGRALMQNETVGWVKSIHESRYGELLGLVMVGPHVTDLIEAGVVALDA